jgi:hypothetical protein
VGAVLPIAQGRAVLRRCFWEAERVLAAVAQSNGIGATRLLQGRLDGWVCGFEDDLGFTVDHWRIDAELHWVRAAAERRQQRGTVAAKSLWESRVEAWIGDVDRPRIRAAS